MANLKKILLVDDDADLREALAEQLLSTEDFDVFEAGDGHSAMDRVREGLYDLVILDQGRIISEGTPQEIIRSLGAENVISVEVDGDFDLAALGLLEGVLEARVDAGRAELQVARNEPLRRGLVVLRCREREAEPP